jgi:hypothetical protein
VGVKRVTPKSRKVQGLAAVQRIEGVGLVPLIKVIRGLIVTDGILAYGGGPSALGFRYGWG